MIANTLVPRRFKHALALAVVAGPLAIASPAQADTPSGSDFTQALPDPVQLRPVPARDGAADHHGDHGPVAYRTPAISAPRSFDLVGVAGDAGPLEYRTQRRGEAWSGWVEADRGEPVYAGGADRVQVRSRGAEIEGRLHYVSIHDGTVPADHLARREAGRPAWKPRSGKLPPQPQFVTRAQWGANSKTGGCLPRETPVTGRVKAGVIHHTVSTNTYTQTEAPGIVLAICRYHRNANGWNDIGYNALVDRFGNLYEGRAGGLGRAIVGAQAEGINSQTTGIASIGDNREFSAPPKERKSIANYLAWKFGIAGIAAEGRATLTSAGGSTQRTPAGQRVRVPRIFSHNFTNFTACAGEALIAQVPQIKRAVARKLSKGGGGETPPAAPPEPPPVEPARP